MRIERRRSLHWVASVALVCLGAVACTSSTETSADGPASDPAPPPTATPEPASNNGAPTPAPTATPVPEAFVPQGPVGEADAYDALVSRLEQEVPSALRGSVPWPDTRNPDPVQAQLAIFDLWIWMAENHPEPALAPIIAVEGSPGREAVTTVFGEMEAANEVHRREQAPYEAFDHRVVTFESAGLPLWFSRGAPEDSVVVYYRDRSGPTTIRDRTSGEQLDVLLPVPDRQWVSIIAPTEVGWLLFRDELIEPGDDIEVPDPAPPSADTGRRSSDV